MWVKMKTLYSGPSGTVQPGGEANLPTDEAKDLLERGYADPVERVETAEASQPEQAAVRTGKRGRK